MRAAQLPLNAPEKNEAFRQRFWEKVEVGGDDECWPFAACRCAHGEARMRYGRAYIGSVSPGKGRVMTAHRVAYILAYGAVEDSLFVCHTCDNPSCCNPKHLYAGTGKDNARDRDTRGRWRGGTADLVKVLGGTIHFTRKESA